MKNKIIQKLNKTVYGSQLNIKNREDWQQIPIIDYDTIEPWIKQQEQQPSSSILTPEKIHFWENTSGSTGAKKKIPYTTSLLPTFRTSQCRIKKLQSLSILRSQLGKNIEYFYSKL